MKRVLTVVTMIALAGLLNGCTKCSQERPAEPPAVVDPNAAPPADGTMPPADGMPTETTTGTDTTTTPQ